jgi:pyruvate kinase
MRTKKFVAVGAGGESKANTIIVFTTSADMAIMVSKRRPHRSIIGVTSSKTVYSRLTLLYGVFPIYSLGLKKKENFREINFDNLNTDWILANTESDIAILNKKLSEETDVDNLMCLRLPKIGDIVVFTAGFHSRFPGLSNSLKISEFGDASRSKRAKANWKESLSKIEKSGKVAIDY